uniref:NADH-ubiquinone oxidoreductase chain 5 n=1 Tax=Habrophlebiodes zijinensis TaxID=289472 RepID=A0A0B4IKD8_9INSE|nr:NADH dehydrogenase subunit 5 [Habrophlebiodes zijinensis]
MLWNMSICFCSFIFLGVVSLISMITGMKFLLSDYSVIVEWEIISLNGVLIVMTILIDWMSLMFMSFVLLISSLVIYYSYEYMSGDINMSRFIILVLMFVFSMMLLIISPNLISILLGWDGLGLVSYCLVIYYQNTKSYSAGMITALSNRVGDVALLIAIAWLMNYGSFNYVFYLEGVSESGELSLVGGLVVLAAMTKSAQIPFSAWLPAAMAAPTPVSALVHSSTLVTAGVYLLIRFSPLLESSNSMKFLLLISGLTMFMAGLGANFEFDLKKIIALSTLSQLGLMMSLLAMGFSKLAFFHLMTHALFKALLFMCAGAVIHNMKNSQDLRKMGGLVSQMPLSAICFNVANLALCGTPFLAGFYSKDLMLEMASLSDLTFLSYFLFFFSTGLTVCYSLRLVYYSMSGGFNLDSLHPMNDEGVPMLKSMCGLMFFSITGGSMLSWLIYPTPVLICLPSGMKMMALLVSLLGGWVGYILSSVSVGVELKGKNNFLKIMFLGSMWFMPALSSQGASFYPLWAGKKMLNLLDQGWSEELGASGLNMKLNSFSLMNDFHQNNNLKVFLFLFMMGFMLLLFLSFMLYLNSL